MNRIVALLLVLGLPLVVVASGYAAEANPEQAKAIAEVKKLGGKVTVDEKSPDQPVIGVKLYGPKVNDAELKHLEGLTNLRLLVLEDTEVTDAGLEHLKGLTKLLILILWNAKVTDTGLEHLQGLTKLQDLCLVGTQITDVGLDHVKGLTNLHRLDLRGTNITDVGLDHIKGLTNLRVLILGHTKVTDEAVKKLQQVLPKCKIVRLDVPSLTPTFRPTTQSP